MSLTKLEHLIWLIFKLTQVYNLCYSCVSSTRKNLGWPNDQTKETQKGEPSELWHATSKLSLVVTRITYFKCLDDLRTLKHHLYQYTMFPRRIKTSGHLRGY